MLPPDPPKQNAYVGYGITTEDGSYDDFEGLDVDAIHDERQFTGHPPASAHAAYHSLNQRVANLVEKAFSGLAHQPGWNASDTQEFFKSINASTITSILPSQRRRGP